MDPLEQNTSTSNRSNTPEVLFITVIGVVLGYLIMSQAYSVEDLNQIVARDRSTNVFQEIQIAYEQNSDLKEEEVALEETLEQYSNRVSFLQAINEEIDRYEKVAGLQSVKGEGIEIVIENSEDLKAIWFVDLVNELFNGGAEAVSVQDIRLVGNNIGFDTLPNGQVFLKGSPIRSPISIKAIGPKQELEDTILQLGGVIERMKREFPDSAISYENKAVIEM